MNSNTTFTCITSVTFGGGLELERSDLDIMFVKHDLVVTAHKQICDYRFSKVYFFQTLKMLNPSLRIYVWLKKISETMYWYVEGVRDSYFCLVYCLNSVSVVKAFLVVHGPCLSDSQGDFDVAYCLHAKSLITAAFAWVTTSNNSWPAIEIKQKIIDHGVLFVPIGTKGDINEELQWRVSFSVGEKLWFIHFLIHSCCAML